MLSELKMIKKLSLRGSGSIENGLKSYINSKQVSQMCLNASQLTHLDIGGCHILDDNTFDHIHTNLKFVNLGNANGISQGRRKDL